MMLPAIKYHVGVLPEKLQLKGYEWWYRLRVHRGVPPPDCAQDRHYSLSAEQIYGANRLPGVSGYYRLFNEEDFLAASVESHLPFFDELILLHDSTTTDRTPEIARALARKYPDKVKCYFYEPAVPKLRTKAYRMLPACHPCSFANYSNFALSKTTRQIVTKLDGDHIAIDTSFARVTDKIHSLEFMQNVFYAYVGINLWSYEDQLYVDTKRATTAVGDIGFHVMRPEKSYYTKRKWNEDGYFSRKHRTLHHAGSLFFHLKNMRRRAPYQSDRGLDDTLHQERFRRRFLESQRYWITWDKFVRRYHETFLTDMATDLAGLPDPHEYLRGRLGSLPTLTHRVLPPPPPSLHLIGGLLDEGRVWWIARFNKEYDMGVGAFESWRWTPYPSKRLCVGEAESLLPDCSIVHLATGGFPDKKYLSCYHTEWYILRSRKKTLAGLVR